MLDRSALPRLGAVLRRDLHLLGGPAVLVYFLVDGRSPLFAGFWALVAAFALSWVRRDTRIGLARSLSILVDSAQAAMPVALACATVGHRGRRRDAPPGSGSSSPPASSAWPEAACSSR